MSTKKKDSMKSGRMAFVLMILIWPGLTVLSGCDYSKSGKNEHRNADDVDAVKTITLALDWSPNILHAPLFWAESKGYFKEEEIRVEWFSPEVDNYKKKPIQRVLDGEVDLCIGPSEHLFFLAIDSTGSARAEAVATILQGDQSCFVVKAQSDIERPRDLEGKIYIGYKTPLEKSVLSAMIAHDGGDPKFEMITPDRLDVWEAFMRDRGDVAWVFSHWEATLAQHQGVDLQKFYPGEFGVPYGYSSVFMARKIREGDLNDRIGLFLRVLSRSVNEMTTVTDTVIARQLCAHIDHPNFSDEVFVANAWRDIRPALKIDNSAPWGLMQQQKWIEWRSWINQQTEVVPGQKVSDQIPDSVRWFTNELLD